MKKLKLVLLLAAAIGLGGTPGLRAETLRVGVAAEATSLDPQFQNLSSNSQLASAVYESLVGRDARSQTYPQLALRWEMESPTSWIFYLRPGVLWHNGDVFTAEDVVFSIERIPGIENSPGPFTTYISTIKNVEAIDPLTVRFTTHEANPVLPLDLSSIFLVNHRVHRNATNEDFSSGRAAIGTGQYKFVSYRAREIMELVRNEAYWGPKPDWEHIEYRMIVNDAARVAALLSGRVDFIDQVPASNVARLRRERGITVSTFPSLRAIFFVVDQTGRGPFAFDNAGNRLSPEALRDHRVRQALSIAIDRQAIVARVMEGAGFASGQFMPEGALGYVDDIAVPRADPVRARALLAEAGYPDGFRITLHGPNGQYPNDAAILQAVAQMWSRIGVKTEVVVQPIAGFLGRAARQEFSAWLASWGSSTGEAGNTLRSIMRSYDRELGTGAANRHRYSNQELDGLIDRMSIEMDPEKRREAMNAAVRFAMEDVAIIPVLMLQNITAMRSTVRDDGRIDSRVHPQEIRRRTN